MLLCDLAEQQKKDFLSFSCKYLTLSIPAPPQPATLKWFVFTFSFVVLGTFSWKFFYFIFITFIILLLFAMDYYCSSNSTDGFTQVKDPDICFTLSSMCMKMFLFCICTCVFAFRSWVWISLHSKESACSPHVQETFPSQSKDKKGWNLTTLNH